MQPDYFENHARARKFPWTLYHEPLERDLARFLDGVRANGAVLVVGCGLLHEIDAAPAGLSFVVADVDPRAVDAVMARRDPRIVDGLVVPPEVPIDQPHRFDAIYAKEVVEHVLAWPGWLAGLRRSLVPGGRLWLSTLESYGELSWLPVRDRVGDRPRAGRAPQRLHAPPHASDPVLAKALGSRAAWCPPSASRKPSRRGSRRRDSRSPRRGTQLPLGTLSLFATELKK